MNQSKTVLNDFQWLLIGDNYPEPMPENVLHSAPLSLYLPPENHYEHLPIQFNH